MEILKTYVTVIDNNGQRQELSFKPKTASCLAETPTKEEITKVVAEISKPPPELNGCPMNNAKCPLYKVTGVIK